MEQYLVEELRVGFSTKAEVEKALLELPVEAQTSEQVFLKSVLEHLIACYETA